MADKIDDGGPAFPQNELSHLGFEPGMSLRDWFAGQALVSMGDRRWEGDANETATQKHARAAYAIADAMLSAREGR